MVLSGEREAELGFECSFSHSRSQSQSRRRLWGSTSFHACAKAARDPEVGDGVMRDERRGNPATRGGGGHLYDNRGLLLAPANHANKTLGTSCKIVKYLYYCIQTTPAVRRNLLS